jgi:hypothetical protein
MLNITRGRGSTRTSWDQTAALLVVALMVYLALAVYMNSAVVLAALAIGFLLVVFMPTTAVMVTGVLVRALVGSFGAIGVLSVTVPFASTVTGLAGLLGLGTLAVWHTAQARSVVAGTLN